MHPYIPPIIQLLAIQEGKALRVGTLAKTFQPKFYLKILLSVGPTDRRSFLRYVASVVNSLPTEIQQTPEVIPTLRTAGT
jgi:hypothetical protein